MDPEAVAACKTLMDLDRLRIVGALAGSDATLEQTAESLNLPGRGIAKHLARVRDAGLVLDRAGDNGLLHSLHVGRLASIAAQHAKRMVILRFLAATAFVPGDVYPEKEVTMRLALRHQDVAGGA